jgi:hypothetical protein
MKHKPQSQRSPDGVAIREAAESRLKIGLISGCDFKETRDDSERLQVMRPHSFALPNRTMSANRYAAVHLNDRYSSGRYSIPRSFEPETDSSGAAAVSGEHTWI